MISKDRFTLRAIDRDEKGSVRQIIEQEIPATVLAIELTLRRKPFRNLIASGLLGHGTITLERKMQKGVRWLVIHR